MKWEVEGPAATAIGFDRSAFVVIALAVSSANASQNALCVMKLSLLQKQKPKN